MKSIRGFRELKVWQKAMDAAMRVFELSKRFPKCEKYSLYGSGTPLIALRAIQYRGSVAQASVSRRLCQQAQRLRGRSR